MKKVLVVLNPVAGETGRKPVYEIIKHALDVVGIACEFAVTHRKDGPGEAVRRRLSDGFDAVIAAGGDGTVATAVNGLIGVQVPLGIIPIGTGNMLAKDLHIPLDIPSAISLLANKPKIRRIDAMKIGDFVYLLDINVGLSASIMAHTTYHEKNHWGMLAYLLSGLREAPRIRFRPFKVTVDGVAYDTRAAEVVVFNSGYIVKYFYPGKHDVRLDDGKLDVWIASPTVVKDYPRYLLGALFGRPNPALTHFVTAERSIIIKGNARLRVDADGDIVARTPVTIENLPGAVGVLVPREDTAVKA